MASVQEPGQIRILVQKQGGQTVEVFSGSVQATAPSGGAPDGAGASVVKPNERIVVPRNNLATCEVNDYLSVEFTAAAADGIDVSDCVWIIPVTLPNGVVKYLSQSDFANPAPADYTTVANIPTIVGRHKAVERFQFGGGPIYLDIQDDTA